MCHPLKPSPLRIPSKTISFFKNSDLPTYFLFHYILNPISTISISESSTNSARVPLAPSIDRLHHQHVLDPLSLFATHHRHLRHRHLPNSYSSHGFTRFSTYHAITLSNGAPQEIAARRPQSVRSKRWPNPGQQYSDSCGKWLYFATSQPLIGFKTGFYSTISKSIFCRAFKC